MATAGNSETYSIKTRTKPTTAISATAMARALSKPVTPDMTGADRGPGAGLPAAATAVGRGAGVGGAGVGAWAAAGAAGAAGATAEATAPPRARRASAGILIGGAAVGVGGQMLFTL